MPNSAAAAFLGTKPLQPEVAKTYEVGARWSSRNLHAEVTAFNLHFDNQIEQIAGTQPPLFQNIGETRHQGVETAIDYEFGEDSVLRGLAVWAEAHSTTMPPL